MISGFQLHPIPSRERTHAEVYTRHVITIVTTQVCIHHTVFVIDMSDPQNKTLVLTESKGLTHMQLNFLIVLILFVLVVILGIINILIHYHEQQRSSVDSMASLGDRGSRINRSGSGKTGRGTRAMLLF